MCVRVRVALVCRPCGCFRRRPLSAGVCRGRGGLVPAIPGACRRILQRPLQCALGSRLGAPRLPTAPAALCGAGVVCLMCRTSDTSILRVGHGPRVQGRGAWEWHWHAYSHAASCQSRWVFYCEMEGSMHVYACPRYVFEISNHSFQFKIPIINENTQISGFVARVDLGVNQPINPRCAEH